MNRQAPSRQQAAVYRERWAELLPVLQSGNNARIREFFRPHLNSAINVSTQRLEDIQQQVRDIQATVNRLSGDDSNVIAQLQPVLRDYLARQDQAARDNTLRQQILAETQRITATEGPDNATSKATLRSIATDPVNEELIFALEKLSNRQSAVTQQEAQVRAARDAAANTSTTGAYADNEYVSTVLKFYGINHTLADELADGTFSLRTVDCQEVPLIESHNYAVARRGVATGTAADATAMRGHFESGWVNDDGRLQTFETLRDGHCTTHAVKAVLMHAARQIVPTLGIDTSPAASADSTSSQSDRRRRATTSRKEHRRKPRTRTRAHRPRKPATAAAAAAEKRQQPSRTRSSSATSISSTNSRSSAASTESQRERRRLSAIDKTKSFAAADNAVTQTAQARLKSESLAHLEAMVQRAYKVYGYKFLSAARIQADTDDLLAQAELPQAEQERGRKIVLVRAFSKLMGIRNQQHTVTAELNEVVEQAVASAKAAVAEDNDDDAPSLGDATAAAASPSDDSTAIILATTASGVRASEVGIFGALEQFRSATTEAEPSTPSATAN